MPTEDTCPPKTRLRSGHGTTRSIESNIKNARDPKLGPPTLAHPKAGACPYNARTQSIHTRTDGARAHLSMLRSYLGALKCHVPARPSPLHHPASITAQPFTPLRHSTPHTLHKPHRTHRCRSRHRSNGPPRVSNHRSPPLARSCLLRCTRRRRQVPSHCSSLLLVLRSADSGCGSRIPCERRTTRTLSRDARRDASPSPPCAHRRSRSRG